MATRSSGRARKPTQAAAEAEAEKNSRKRPAAASRATQKKKKSAPPADRKILALFDVDGTLTVPRQSITPEMHDFMMDLRDRVVVGVVGGSDLPKQKEQVGEEVIHEYDYSFSENGLIAYKNGELIHTKSMRDELGEENLKEFINFVLKYLSDVDCPVKRGTFIEYRTGMLNVSPVGRQCSQQERDDFEKYDKEHKIREKMVAVLTEKFGGKFNLKFSIGGQISFDVFPKGWDKTYCLQFVEKEGYEEIHFFGDKTFEGGNDFEIFSDPRVKGHTVTSWQDTMKQCKELFVKEESAEENGSKKPVKKAAAKKGAKKTAKEEEAEGENDNEAADEGEEKKNGEEVEEKTTKKARGKKSAEEKKAPKSAGRGKKAKKDEDAEKEEEEAAEDEE